MAYDIDKCPAQSGRVIGEDGEVYNLVDLMQGGASVSDNTYDIDKYPANEDLANAYNALLSALKG